MSWNSEDWKAIAKAISGFAPVLGTVIGGPVGGAIGTGVKILAGNLGVEETPDAIMEAIITDPLAAAKIKQAELDNASELNQLAYQTLQIEMKTNADIIQALNNADASGQSTRPKIALMMAWMLAVPYGFIGLSFAWSIFQDPSIIKDIWITLGAYLGIPLTLLRMYFGDLRKEHAQTKGQQVDFGMLGGLFGAKNE